MPKTATKRPLSPVERAVERQKMLALLGYQDRALTQGKALWNAGKGFVNEGLGSLIAGAEYAGDRSVTKEVPKDINRLGKMVAQNAGGYADAGNALWQMVKGDGKQAVPDYYRNKAGQAYQEQFNPSPADPRLERFGNFYADPAAVAFGAGRAARGVADPKLWRGIAEDMARGARSNAIENLWHASPHEFDSFDLNKVGTGEGAQAYGHGAYLAESPAVSGVDGRYYNEFKQSHGNANAYEMRLAWPDAREATDPLSPDHFLHWNKPLSEQSDFVKSRLPQEYQGSINAFDSLDVAKDNFHKSLRDMSQDLPTADAEYRAAMRATEGLRDRRSTPLGILLRENGLVGFTGGSSSVTDPFRDAGIPGIRHLDGSTEGAGSHNYVVFDDKLIDIVSRNGQPIK